VDRLAGFNEAIGAVYPDVQIQRCVIHMLRNSFKYVNYSALEKMLYPASGNVVKKWTQRYRNWDQVLNLLIVLYGERLTL